MRPAAALPDRAVCRGTVRDHRVDPRRRPVRRPSCHAARRPLPSLAVVASILASSPWPARPRPRLPQARPRTAPARLSLGLPDDERLEQAGRQPPGACGLAPLLIAFMGLTSGVHPDFGTFAGYGIPVNPVRPTHAALHRRRSSGPANRTRPLPDPRVAEDRGQRRGWRPPPADGRPGACQLWELYAASHGSGRLDGRLRRDLGPPLERASAGRLDVRRRRRAADLSRASPATTRSPPG